MNKPTPTDGVRFLGLDLNPDVSKNNMRAFYLICFSSIMVAVFIAGAQPFVLEEILGIPTESQGTISGSLAFWGEIVIILTASMYGALSDKIGRKHITVIGFLLMAGGVFAYGFAKDYKTLLIARLIFALGFSALNAMLIALVADYARNRSRGRATGYLGVMNGLGAMIAVLVLLKLPAYFSGRGMDPATAAFTTYAIIAGIVVVIAALLFLGLKPGLSTSSEHTEKNLWAQSKEGFAAAKDPGVRLAYFACFVARGNLAVVGTFFTLWAALYGKSELGLTYAEGIAKGGAFLVISYVASLLSAPIFGILSDRMNRVSALSVTLFIGFIGYGSTFFINDPFSGKMLISLVLIGMAEVGCIITSGVLIAQQAPAAIRGSVIGTFSLCGAIGILFASKAGGWLFDHWMATGPFVLFGLVAGLVFIWSLIVKPTVFPFREKELGMRSVVITGSTRGIGRGLAEEFLKSDCQVTISGRSQSDIDKNVAELAAVYGADNVAGEVCEVTDANTIQALWNKANSTFGKVDIWVNNAGMSIERKPLHETSNEDIEKIVDVNLTGLLLCSKTVMAEMFEQGFGQIWNMEGFGSNGQTAPGMTPYGATKRAVTYINKALQKEVKGTEVKVCTLSPGIVVTDLLVGDYDLESDEWAKSKKFLNILGDKVETVTPYLVNGILSSNSSGAKVRWLTTGKAFRRFMTAGFNKRDLFTEIEQAHK